MAEIIYRWLEQEVCLSQPIQVLEEDFKNGFLIAEILHKYNQQQDMSQYVNNNSSHSMINNWCRLEPALRNIGLLLSSKVANEIMTAKHGAILALLYKMKVTLDKIAGRPAAYVGRDSMYGAKRINNMPNRTSKPSYDASRSLTFERAIRVMADNQVCTRFLVRHKSFCTLCDCIQNAGINTPTPTHPQTHAFLLPYHRLK